MLSYAHESLHRALTTLLDRLDSPAVARAHVIRWGCPVPAFGDLASSRVATLGLNPSNREFVDDSGKELEGDARRFHTLRSLGLPAWSDVDARHMRLILDSCSAYFRRNPYDRWFKRLDYVVSGAGASFYDVSRAAVHLDLIPYATTRKWMELTPQQRSALLDIAGDTLGLLLRDSPVRVLILNGRSVVELFQETANVSLDCSRVEAWSLPRQSGSHVVGLAYAGVVSKLAGVRLANDILILGYNHNLQSSYGVTSAVVTAIRTWISRATTEFGQ